MNGENFLGGFEMRAEQGQNKREADMKNRRASNGTGMEKADENGLRRHRFLNQGTRAGVGQRIFGEGAADGVDAGGHFPESPFDEGTDRLEAH